MRIIVSETNIVMFLTTHVCVVNKLRAHSTLDHTHDNQTEQKCIHMTENNTENNTGSRLPETNPGVRLHCTE